MRLGKSASAAIAGAVSDIFGGLSRYDNGVPVDAVAVSITSATNRFDAALTALASIREIFVSHELKSGFIEWRRSLDFDALFAAGVDQGYIPADRSIWDALVRLDTTPDSNATIVLEHVVDAVTAVRDCSESFVGFVAQTQVDNPRRMSDEAVDAALRLQARAISLLTLTRMVSYLNAIPPLGEGADGSVPAAATLAVV